MARFLGSLLLLLSAVLAASAASVAEPGQSQTAADPRAVIDALREGGLRAAAKLTGHYVGEEKFASEFIAEDLADLADASSLVIIGRPVGNRCRLSVDGLRVYTDYTVQVQRVFHGAIQPGAQVVVTVLGGMVRFEDGTSAEIRTPGFRRPEDNLRYVLFLSEAKDGSGRFDVTLAAQGLFELHGNGTVRAGGRAVDEVAKKYHGKPHDSFLKEVQKVTTG